MGSGKCKCVQVRLCLEKTANARRAAVNPAYPQSPGDTAAHLRWGFYAGLKYTSVQERLRDGLCEDDPTLHALISCVPTLQIWWWNRACDHGQPGRVDLFLDPAVLSWSNPGLCRHAFHAKAVTWNSGLAMGLHKTSSWALIPVVLLTHWVASGKSYWHVSKFP